MAFQDKKVMFKIDEERDYWFRAEAKARGLTYSGIIKKALTFYSLFSPMFLDATKDTSKDMGLTQAAFIQGVVNNAMCQNAAFKTIFGVAGADALRPFRWDQDGKLLMDEELTKELFDEYVEIFKRFQILLVEQLESKEPGFRVTPEVFQMALSQTQEGNEHSI